jgi:hypothetical protein
MTSVPQTIVAVLFYALPPAFNFARLVADLDAALDGLPHAERRIGWDCDDVALVDVDGGRIVLAFADQLHGALPACLAVTVGPGPATGLPDPLTWRAEPVARMIIARIAARLPAAEARLITVEGVMTAERLDSVIEALAEPPHAPAEAPAATGQAEADAGAPEPAAQAGPQDHRAAARRTGGFGGDAPDTAALDRLMARMERELCGLGRDRAAPSASPPANPPANPPAAPPEPAAETPDPMHAAPGAAEAAAAAAPVRPAAPVLKGRADTGALARAKARGMAAAAACVANDLPDLPRPARAEMDRIRCALYPPEADAPEAPSTAARLAVGTMGVTLVIVAAPVGAALLTYNTLRGADLALTARAVALTGAAFGLMQAQAVQTFLPFG